MHHCFSTKLFWVLELQWMIRQKQERQKRLNYVTQLAKISDHIVKELMLNFVEVFDQHPHHLL